MKSWIEFTKRLYANMKINELRNKNRGYKKLEVWTKSIELYVLISDRAYSLKRRPYKVINQLLIFYVLDRMKDGNGYFVSLEDEG